MGEGEGEGEGGADGWIEDSPPPPPATKLVIKRPFALPSTSAAATPVSKAEAAVTPGSKAGGGVGAGSYTPARTPSHVGGGGGGGGDSLQGGLQAVLKLMTCSKEFKSQYILFFAPVSTEVSDPPPPLPPCPCPCFCGCSANLTFLITFAFLTNFSRFRSTGTTPKL